MKGFKQFLLRGNVIDLAVAVVIGAAFGAVVAALVKDLITPLIALVIGKPDFSALVLDVRGTKFPIGDFINALLSFLFVAAAIYYFVVLPVNAIVARARRGEAVRLLHCGIFLTAWGPTSSIAAGPHPRRCARRMRASQRLKAVTRRRARGVNRERVGKRSVGQHEVRNVGEVGPIERPQRRTVRNRARGDREIDLAAARPRHLFVQARRPRGIIRPERNGLVAREQQLLIVQFVPIHRSTRPPRR